MWLLGSPKPAGSLDWLTVIYRHRKLRIIPEGMTGEEQQERYAIV
jgi:hypothetical protein